MDYVELEAPYDNLYLIDGMTGRRLANVTGNGNTVAWPVRSDSSYVVNITWGRMHCGEK